MCFVLHQILGAVRLAALENLTTLRAHHEHLRIGRMEHQTRAACLQPQLNTIGTGTGLFVQQQRDDWRDQQLTLGQHPVENASIARHTEKVYLAVGHVWAPLHLGHQVGVLAADAYRIVDGLGLVDLQIVYGHIAVVHS